jgi:hypothetical protein
MLRAGVKGAKELVSTLRNFLYPNFLLDVLFYFSVEEMKLKK